MATLTGSVGKNGLNFPPDVKTVQGLLNRWLDRGLLPPLSPVKTDGECGPGTELAIGVFQKRAFGMANPPCLVDNWTLLKLEGPLPSAPVFDADFEYPATWTWRDEMICRPTGYIPPDFLFPFRKLPSTRWYQDGLFFGAKRSKGKRRHAGCDILMPQGTPVYAVADADWVRGPYPRFTEPSADYPNRAVTDEVQIKHGPILVRYGEIRPGSYVGGSKPKKGQKIAEVGGCQMLHMEIYLNPDDMSKLKDTKLPKLQRRADITDPAPYLNVWQHRLPE